jgi:hypothetical protein
MADIRQAYGTAADATITLASFASDTNLLAGRQSNAVDNTSALALDYLVSGKITTGTSPTASRQIEVWAVGSWDGSNYPDVITGAGDASKTVTSSDIKNSICRLVAVMATSSTSNVTYHFGPVSIASAFGGVCPPKFVLFVVHNTAVALNATAGNHQIRLLPCYETVA